MPKVLIRLMKQRRQSFISLVRTCQFLSTSSSPIAKWFLTLSNSLQNNFNFPIFIAHIGHNIGKIFKIPFIIRLLSPLISSLNQSCMIAKIIDLHINWINKLRQRLAFDQPIYQLYVRICCYYRTYYEAGQIVLVV